MINIKKYFFTFLLPVIWATVSFTSYHYPGDEYGLYCYSSILGIWPIYFIKGIKIQSIFFPMIVALTGAIVMLLVGFSSDKLQINRRLWLILWLSFSILIFIAYMIQFTSIERALSKHGSWTAYIAFSLNIALYISIFFSAIIQLVSLKIKK
ncbi:MAG: hypothetical protein A2Y12_01480 [Planctomycetes bacterium GWF2_42_9]|nr:MAG: hypothetical protein A2Y12_01480 [Planctomycetes bacterium GWF2_42_9]